jgi:uncharacterized protein (TIGR02186 family)
MLIKLLTKQILPAAAAACLLIPALPVLATDAPLQLKLAADTIEISTFYNGTTLEVSGTIPADADVVLQVSGPKQDVHLKKKGKVAGFLWMNKTDVSLENIPAEYMLYTPDGSAEQFIHPEFGVGYKALLDGITIEPATEDKAFIFGEYVKLMEKSGLYSINDAAISYGSTGADSKSYTATLNIPSKMSAGSYTVEAIAVLNGAVIDRTTENLNLVLTGFPKLISSLAYGSPLLFGIMAVFIAIGTGLIIGVIFRGSGGGAH